MPERKRNGPNIASFCPPRLLPEPAAGASHPSDHVLLDKKAYIAARTTSSGGDTVGVSFCLAAPPALSYACVQCPGLQHWCGFSAEPVVAAAAGPLVLLLVRFIFGPMTFFCDAGIRDFLVYRAGPGAPSLTCLPQLPFTIQHNIKPHEVGVVPCCGNGGEDEEEGFVVAALVPLLDTRDRPDRPLDLHLFSSRSGAWRTVVPRQDASSSCDREDSRPSSKKLLFHETSKVIAVGGGVLGWVELWCGVLLCDVLADDDPVVRLVPVPRPVDGRVWRSTLPMFRDVASDGNGLLSFVEVEYPETRRHDGDFLPPTFFDMLTSEDSDDGEGRVANGWRATTWRRTLFSSDGDDHWKKDCTADSADILCAADASKLCSGLLLPEQSGEDGVRALESLDDCYAPVLSTHDDGVVYMMSSVNRTYNDREALVAAFDVRKRTLRALAPFSAERYFSLEGICLPCSFSRYLATSA